MPEGHRNGRGRVSPTPAPRVHFAGDPAVKVTEAAVAKEPPAYVLGVGKLADGTYVARMMRPDGTRIVLMIDANFAVTSVDDAPERVPGQGRGAGKGAKNNASTASPTASS